jgi:hypothetical protein
MVNWMAKEPMPPELHPISNMDVISLTVANRTESRHLDAGVVRADVIKRLNQRSKGLVFTEDRGRNVDGTLAVTILEESGEETESNPKNGNVTWKFQVKFSATLTDPSGRLVWNRPAGVVTHMMTYDGPIPSGVHPGWDTELANGDPIPFIADSLVNDLARLR